MYSDFNKCRLGPVTLFVDFTITSGEEKGTSQGHEVFPPPPPLFLSKAKNSQHFYLLFMKYCLFSIYAYHQFLLRENNIL